MAAGYKDFTAGAVLAAADLEDYTQNQSIMRFASAAARDTALSVVKTEGMMAYLLDVNTVTVYSGAAWSTVGPLHGVATAYTPVVVQAVTPTLTNNNSWYIRIGRLIIGAFYVTMTSGGTAANPITISLPVNGNASVGVVGSGYLKDVSSGETHLAVTMMGGSGTVMKMLGTTYNASGEAGLTLGSGIAPIFLVALASGDLISGTFQYQAAADA